MIQIWEEEIQSVFELLWAAFELKAIIEHNICQD